MKLSIITVNTTTKTTANGKPYQVAEVVYKNLESNKVENKNITSYSKVFKGVSEAAAGQVFLVKSEKDDKGYWQWVSFDRQMGEAAEVKTSAAVPAKTGGNWETSEERAKKQVYIVKQSSLSNAIALLSVGAKTPPNVDQVLLVAQQFTDWVFADKAAVDLFDQPNDDVDVA